MKNGIEFALHSIKLNIIIPF